MKNYAMLGIVVLVLVAVAVWYFLPSSSQQQTAVQTSAVEQNQLPPLTSGNTTANIATDLSQIPNDSAALTQDQNSVSQSIQGL